MAKRSKRKPAEVAASAEPASADDFMRGPLYFWLGVAAIVLAVFWVYSPSIHGDWLWDDDWYITSQPLLRNLNGLWKFWFAPGSWVEYYPVEETLLWIEWHLFGNDTLGYHVVTITLHALNALLVWRLLARLGLRKAWLGGFLFAVHPAAVDSVAWIAETKNTLSTLPCLLAMIVWVDFENDRKPRDYALAFFYFALALLCKIAVAPLPFVLVLYAWWKRRRISGRDLAAVAPFLAIAVILAAISIAAGGVYAQQSGKTPDALPSLDLAARIALAGQSLGVYFAHLVWPVGLLPNYPQWTIGAPSPLAFIPCLVVVAVFVVLWLRRARWGAPALLALGAFVLFLAPFTGLVNVSYMAFTWVMDHYLYLAMIGPIGLVIAALDSIDARLPAQWRISVTGAATLIATLLAFEARGYAGAFVDEATLWGYTAERNPGDWLAHDNLGKAQLLANQPDDAVKSFSTALLLRPGRAQTHLNLGRAFVALNRLNDGLFQYDTALAIDPTDAEIYNQKGVAFIQADRAADALAPLQRAVELRPHYAIGLENLGIALAITGHLDEAVERFHASLAANPDDPATHVNLGRALHQLGRTGEANDQFRQALQLDPNNAAAKASLGQP
jgi:tetratricopeptide (TPR) repeat protein